MLKDSVQQLNATLWQLEKGLSKNSKHSGEFIPILYSRIQYIHDTHILALESYDGLDLTNSTKRGLTDGIAKLSHVLFGTVMNEDVEELRERYNQLTSVAFANNKAIHLNCRNIAKLKAASHNLLLAVT